MTTAERRLLLLVARTLIKVLLWGGRDQPGERRARAIAEWIGDVEDQP